MQTLEIPMPDGNDVIGLRPGLQQATALLKERQTATAADLAGALTKAYPDSVDAWLLASHAEQQLGRFEGMLERAGRALGVAPDHRGAQFRLMECQLYCGQVDRVIGRLERMEAAAGDDHGLLVRIAEFYTHAVRHADAKRCYERAVELEPSNPGYCFSLAAALTAAGDIDGAERMLDRVIELDPGDYDAYRNRSTLKRQAVDSNHVDEMQALLAAGVTRPAGEAQLCYALAKEYEDLGRYDEAFTMLRRGADARRRLMRYRVASDVTAMKKIAGVYSADWCRQTGSGCQEHGPVFVMGLPRSGTTLVDRILASHSDVASLGEINDFAYALMRTAGGGGKLDLIPAAADADTALLGQRYVDATRAFGAGARYLIDKTPLNYLYIGLLHRALPNARIILVQRNAMDSCYGMYRTLFRAGYPFSYDLDDLAQYYVAYTCLIEHWRAAAPGALLEIRYEDLVDDQETVSRQIIDYCGLDWEPACLEFHRNAAPVATASSAQVRRPLYRDAVGRWHRYERQLQPLVARLRAAGIDTGHAQ